MLKGKTQPERAIDLEPDILDHPIMRTAQCVNDNRPNHTRGSLSAGTGMLCVMAGAVLLFVHWQLYEHAYDDAYIYFRVAARLLDHGAPYFNLLEPLKGSSSSGWTTVLCVLTVFRAERTTEIRVRRAQCRTP